MNNVKQLLRENGFISSIFDWFHMTTTKVAIAVGLKLCLQITSCVHDDYQYKGGLVRYNQYYLWLGQIGPI